MSLPWVRIDSGIASHDKVLNLLNDPSPKRHQAAFSYVCSIAWAANQGTDGRIPRTALPFIHGSTTTARLLQVYRLWEEAEGGWRIRNFAMRQELSAVTAGKREAQRVGGLKGACLKHHGPDCGCWQESA